MLDTTYNKYSWYTAANWCKIMINSIFQERHSSTSQGCKGCRERKGHVSILHNCQWHLILAESWQLLSKLSTWHTSQCDEYWLFSTRHFKWHAWYVGLRFILKKLDYAPYSIRHQRDTSGVNVFFRSFTLQALVSLVALRAKKARAFTADLDTLVLWSEVRRIISLVNTW